MVAVVASGGLIVTLPHELSECFSLYQGFLTAHPIIQCRLQKLTITGIGKMEFDTRTVIAQSV
jgi:hypothetical protein